VAGLSGVFCIISSSIVYCLLLRGFILYGMISLFPSIYRVTIKVFLFVRKKCPLLRSWCAAFVPPHLSCF